MPIVSRSSIAFGRYWYVPLANRVVFTSLLVPGGNIPGERELREGRLKFNLASQSADFPQFPVCACHVIAGRPCSPALNFHNDSPGSIGLGNISLSIPITESVLFSNKLNESGQSRTWYRN